MRWNRRISAGSKGGRSLCCPGSTVSSTPRPTAPLSGVAEPVVALVAQGAKRAVLGNQVFDYAAGQFLVVTLDLPLTSSITVATAELIDTSFVRLLRLAGTPHDQRILSPAVKRRFTGGC